MKPRQDHLTWPLLTDTLREATQRLRDAEWDGLDTTTLRLDVIHLRAEIASGGTYVVPF